MNEHTVMRGAAYAVIGILGLGVVDFTAYVSKSMYVEWRDARTLNTLQDLESRGRRPATVKDPGREFLEMGTDLRIPAVRDDFLRLNCEEFDYCSMPPLTPQSVTLTNWYSARPIGQEDVPVPKIPAGTYWIR